MKSYILSLLLIVFSFIVVHDFVIMAKDYDTQNELILKASGEIDTEQMCKPSQLHDILHEMIVASDILFLPVLSSFEVSMDVPVFHQTYHPLFSPQNLYRPPIA